MAMLKACVICGGAFWAKWRTLTCSTDCSRKQVRERKRLYRETHHEQICEYRNANREQTNRQLREKRKANPEQVGRKERKYRRTHREQIRERSRERKRLQRLAYEVLKQFPGVLLTTQQDKNDD
jgi:hypothetical protein